MFGGPYPFCSGTGRLRSIFGTTPTIQGPWFERANYRYDIAKGTAVQARVMRAVITGCSTSFPTAIAIDVEAPDSAKARQTM